MDQDSSSEVPAQLFQFGTEPAMESGLSFDPKSLQLDTKPRIEKLKRIALRQRMVMVCLLVNLFNNILFMNFYIADTLQGYALLGISICVAAFTMYSAFQLAIEVSSTVVAVICTLLMLVPVISLLGLLFVNQKAVNYFKRYRIPVGFFGADPDSIKAD